ncbi:3-hydroxyacyl-CoA dehyrogenase, putative [Talaromyces stipitatus ATCC 10500]|uniref:3-hydroxyacyl-CoA dehyrogenase, putative n=1 Tax=Talaromyces stipitatus (strain ATCC 10500 / CBS 375.48 / QM 6759 / NRRL 1006) TaxID=441959 RepID=B8MNC8_TALSN|nr:3-hydroxyacyl-CoA dehyrogenase, putative [Talaromyces stipitatus ATCC 10500]EED14017.1 3-hydroxyacyl-CoA dehyrogenase, putative [Talaromyces stipitatus ATCC 10500]
MARTKLLRDAVVILGAGTQGRRLAYMWSSTGKPVHLVDRQEKQLSEGIDYVQQLRASPSAISKNWGNITTSSPDRLNSALQQAWLAIECVPENINLKRTVISELDAIAPEQTIIASNSSSYVISEIIEPLTLKNPARVLSAHCYWPPETPAIEIMGHDQTDPSIIELMLNQSQKHGFSPYHVKSTSIGYIYNRIWAAIKRETLLALHEGVATPKEIDAIFKDVLKTPRGPCELMDVVGLDVVLDIENHYADSRKGLPIEPRQYLDNMIKEGKLGFKNRRGFYEYPS